MYKRIIPAIKQDKVQQEQAPSVQNWLNLEQLAQVELTSEDTAYPVESALLPEQASEWRAAEPGKQTIRLVFPQPQTIQCIALKFVEASVARTQEYALRWSADGGQSFREIVRQQWNFNPHDATCELEEHRVELSAVSVLELSITPDINGGSAIASLASLQLA